MDLICCFIGNLTFGDLAEFSVLDTRQYRDNQVGSGFPGGPVHPDASNPERTLTGSEQMEWLLEKPTAFACSLECHSSANHHGPI